MEVEIRGKFYIIAIGIHKSAKLGSSQGDNFCVVKGILGTKKDLDNTKLNKLSANAITTLLISKKTHSESITRIKTGCEIHIIGHINYQDKSYQPIYVKKISTLKTT